MSHLEKELELNCLEATDELQINTVTQQPRQQNSEKPKPTCHYCKKPSHYRNQCRQLKQEKDQTRKNMNSADNSNNKNGSRQTNSNSNNKVSNNTIANNINIQKDRRPRPVYPHCQTCGRTNRSVVKCYFEANAANKPPLRNIRPEGQNQVLQRNAQSNSDGNVEVAAQALSKKRNVFTPELHVTDLRQLKYLNIHKFPSLSGSNPRRHL